MKIVVNFSEFSDKVDKRQQIFKLNRTKEKEKDFDLREPENKKIKNEPPVTDKPEPMTESVKKSKNESFILQETSQSSSNHCSNDSKPHPTSSTENKEPENSFMLKRQRRKSVLFIQSIETLLANEKVSRSHSFT